MLTTEQDMKFRAFIAILESHGFVLDRTRGSARQYVGTVGGRKRTVSVHVSREGDDIKQGTLGSMIRQSGLPKKLFR